MRAGRSWFPLRALVLGRQELRQFRSHSPERDPRSLEIGLGLLERGGARLSVRARKRRSVIGHLFAKMSQRQPFPNKGH
jgi:hypothetical protein